MSECPFNANPGEAIVRDEKAQLDFSQSMSYGDYLSLDSILNAQHPRSPDHNEMLFIVQHQTSELWMKLMLHELRAAIAHLAKDELSPAFKMLARVSKIMEQLVHAWDVLATMTPPEYSAIRPYLASSSGFQSHQYRCIEFALGNKNAAMLKPHTHRPDLLAQVQAAFVAPSLYDEALRLLARRGISIPTSHKERDWSMPYTASTEVEAAWLVVYRQPEKYWDLYPRDAIQLAPNCQRPAKAPDQLVGSSEFRSYHLADMDPNSDEFHRIMRHGYLACTSYSDKLTGDVLAELDRLGLADNTIVVLWGDHGWHLGEHNFWGKHNTMHLAIRVPLIVRVPGKKPGVSSSLVETTDLFPSLCALAGIATPATVQGRDFTALLDDPNKKFHEAAYSRFLNADAVITDQFSYTSYDNGKSQMLYDLSKDPQENKNIADDPNHAETVATMKKLLKKRMEQAKK